MADDGQFCGPSQSEGGTKGPPGAGGKGVREGGGPGQRRGGGVGGGGGGGSAKGGGGGACRNDADLAMTLSLRYKHQENAERRTFAAAATFWPRWPSSAPRTPPAVHWRTPPRARRKPRQCPFRAILRSARRLWRWPMSCSARRVLRISVTWTQRATTHPPLSHAVTSTSLWTSLWFSSQASTRGNGSRCWPAFMSAASSCSPGRASVPLRRGGGVGGGERAGVEGGGGAWERGGRPPRGGAGTGGGILSPPNARGGAILKATNLCATDPARVARSLVDRGITAVRLCPADTHGCPLW